MRLLVMARAPGDVQQQRSLCLRLALPRPRSDQPDMQQEVRTNYGKFPVAQALGIFER